MKQIYRWSGVLLTLLIASLASAEPPSGASIRFLLVDKPGQNGAEIRHYLASAAGHRAKMCGMRFPALRGKAMAKVSVGLKGRVETLEIAEGLSPAGGAACLKSALKRLRLPPKKKPQQLDIQILATPSKAPPTKSDESEPQSEEKADEETKGAGEKS
jgi:hypothetical protein